MSLDLVCSSTFLLEVVLSLSKPLPVHGNQVEKHGRYPTYIILCTWFLLGKLLLQFLY